MGLHTDRSVIARGFASEFGIDVDADIHLLGKRLPAHPAMALARLDKTGKTLVHITDESGADYYISRIDYWRNAVQVHASRVVAMVMPGYRTKLAYWTKAAAQKVLVVHSGVGYLIIGKPVEEDSEDEFTADIFHLDPAVTPEVTIPSGRFYTIEAASWIKEPLVISALCEMDRDGHWENLEIAIEPGQEILEAPEGIFHVPDEFVSAQFN